MNTQVKQVIDAYHGYGYETAGVILAFFNDAQQAEDCADKLQTLSSKPDVEIWGSQLSLGTGQLSGSHEIS